MVSVTPKYTYENPEGERISATSHEFVTRLKDLGYTRVTDVNASPEQPSAVEEVVETPVVEMADEILVPQEEIPPDRSRGRRG